jgi:hypothetical protein
MQFKLLSPALSFHSGSESLAFLSSISLLLFCKIQRS